MTSRSKSLELCSIRNGTDCMLCSVREPRLGIIIMDDLGAGGFNFFICKRCLHDLVEKIDKRKM